MDRRLKDALKALPPTSSFSGDVRITGENGSHSTFSFFVHGGQVRYQCHVSRSFNGPEAAERVAEVVREAATFASTFTDVLNAKATPSDTHEVG